MTCSIDTGLAAVSKRNRKAHNNAQTYDKTLADLQGFLSHELERFPKGKLLDAGCAYGTLSGYLKEQGWDVHAIDAMPELSSQKWWDGLGIPFAPVNLETDEIPFSDFDMVLFTEVLEHLNYNPVPVIQKLYDSTKPGGLIICTTPMKERQGEYHPNDGRYANYAHYRDIPLPWNGYHFEDKHQYFYRLGELAQLFHEVGFMPVEAYPIRKGTTHYLLARRPR